MAPKQGPIPEAALAFIHRAACIQMNLSDAYLFLGYLYRDDEPVTSFGAYSQDKSSLKWFYARSTLRYITERGNRVCIPYIQMPKIDTQGCIECVTAVLNMERKLTEVLQNLRDLALNIEDSHTLKFSEELILKQRQDEERLTRELDQLKTREEQAEKNDDEDEPCLSPRKMPRR